MYYLVKTNRYLSKLIKPFRFLVHALKFNAFTDKQYIQKTFERLQGYSPNLITPRTFSEKIQWFKLHVRNRQYSELTDKIQVRAYVTSKIGEHYLIPLYFTTARPQDITIASLPATNFVIKTNHASGKVFIFKHRDEVNFKQLHKDLLLLMQFNFYHAHREHHYKNIRPQIMVEQFIQTEQGEVPNDYKFHCFDGCVHAIQVDTQRFTNHCRIFYDTEWNKLPIALRFPLASSLPRPKMLSKMLELVATLAADFVYVRVDLYATDDAIYFGELTFTPGAGFEKFSPLQIDEEWGKLYQLNIYPGV